MRRIVEESPYYSMSFFESLGVGLDEAYWLMECRSCGLVFIGNPASDEVLQKLYAVESEGLAEHLAVFARPARLANQLNVYSRVLGALAERVSRDKRGVPLNTVEILDFGAGIGAGLLSIARKGFPFRAFAVESSPTVIDFLGANGVVACSGINEFGEGQRFDAIVLNDVLEHVKEPVSLLRELSARLKAHGVVWIAVPDFSRWRLDSELEAYRVGAALNKEINPLEHLSYFSPHVLDRVAAMAGLRRVREVAASIRVPRSKGLKGLVKNSLRALRDLLRVQRGLEHRFTTAALFELAPGQERARSESRIHS
jgi:2-polyprenyl-3-methyl-5-hydroxy-6-metoxy-1,4-benzoquinol methylase